MLYIDHIFKLLRFVYSPRYLLEQVSCGSFGNVRRVRHPRRFASRTFYGYSCGASDTCPYDMRAPRSFDRVLTSEAPGMRVLYIIRCGEWRLSGNFVGEGRASDIGK